MTATTTVRAAKSNKPMTRVARWMHQDPLGEFAADRGACLAIWVGEECDAYEVYPVLEGTRVVKWIMRKCDPSGDVVEYTLPGDLSDCGCPHTRHRPFAAPCRHRAALKAALTRLGFEF